MRDDFDAIPEPGGRRAAPGMMQHPNSTTISASRRSPTLSIC